MSVFEATEAMLGRLGERAPDVAASPFAMLALELATQLDDPSNSATSKAGCAKEFRDTMTALMAMAPADKGKSELDDLRKRRAARTRRAAAKTQRRP